MKLYDPKKILVPVDFSEWSRGVLRAGLEIGRHRSAGVSVIHVAREADYLTLYGGEITGAVSWNKFREDAQKELEGRLRELLEEASAGPGVRSVLVFGDPAKEIVKFAESEDMDLIVMATSGRMGLSRFFLGSVTEQVIRRAHCPVLVIRAKEAEKYLNPARVGREAMN